MGDAARGKGFARGMRRAFGPEALDEIRIIDIRSKRSAAILRRGFFGRIWWLLTGR